MADGSLTDDPLLMANTFASSFAGVFDGSVPVDQRPHATCTNIFPPLQINEEVITEVILSIDRNSSPGPDNLHPRLLQELISNLALPLKIIFTNSLRTGLLPDLWRESSVVPIFKKASRYNPLNYRPVALTSVACKVMERVVTAALWDYISVNNLISREQFGFRKGHSTIDQLILTYEDVTRWCDGGAVVDVVFFDFEKAFDRVSHSIILSKLEHLGVCGPVLKWIEHFLSRVMRVRVSGALSSPVRVESGVPQGSVLGPVLFLLYINHAVAHLDCNYKIFADDVKLYLSLPLQDGSNA